MPRRETITEDQPAPAPAFDLGARVEVLYAQASDRAHTHWVERANVPLEGQPGHLELTDYPIKLNAIQMQMLNLADRHVALGKQWEPQIIEIKAEIHSAVNVDVKGAAKPVFSNEEARGVELQKRLAELPGYTDSENERNAIAGALRRLEIERDLIAAQFAVAKLYYERGTAALIAQGPAATVLGAPIHLGTLQTLEQFGEGTLEEIGDSSEPLERR